MTPSQLATLKADILADSTFSALPNTPDNNFAIAVAYNQAASPNFTVWKTSVSAAEARSAFIWTEFIARSAGERDAWALMLATGSINPADPNVRQGINDIFSGAGGLTSRTNLTALGKRFGKRIEKLFATGTGSDAVPATMTFEGSIAYIDVTAARNLP